ncbi:alpha/beta fold hydrolase [Sphingosinicella sp. YJ22]|uniref:alpha/beta hydrolase n=1 Tax=Sphingosinicella sp. YJ22 TaxID=1104780 RepID=UPI00140DA888|nr:alpha/beta fold hydrolase [Sphingosinicella sp. YJ22]
MTIATILAALAVATAPVSTEVSVPGPDGALRGTLTAPEGNARAAVLILPGSGPTDRDGNNPIGVRAAPYRLLAEGLAERGVASVRIDKRGLFGSREAVPNGNAATIADYAADVGAWLPEVRRRTGASCVWLLGHSEGGLVALAAREREGVCGLILATAPGRPLGQVIREQLRANPANAPFLDEALAAIDRLERGERVDEAGVSPVLRPLFNAAVQPLLIDLMSHDPARMIAGYDRPVLILSGGRDVQIGEADARALSSANPGARLVVLPNVNHVLKAVDSDDRAANLATYGNANLPLADGVVSSIADFLAEHPAR